MIVRQGWQQGVACLTVRERREVRGLVIHRIEVSQEDCTYGDSPEDVARFFSEHPVGRAATGGQMPYPIVIEDNGCVTQMVPFGYVTPHARAHNQTTIGIALVGDFRSQAPKQEQYGVLVKICAHLLSSLSLGVDAIWAHDELQDGSVHIDKECPGAYLPMVPLKEAVGEILGVDMPTLQLVWGDE